MKKAIFFASFCLLFFLLAPVLAVDVGVRVGENGNIVFDDPSGEQNLYYGIVDSGGQSGHLIKLQTFTSPSTWADKFKVDKSGNVTASGDISGNRLCIGVDCRNSWASIGDQWTTSGNNIYNSNTGNVGIGTASPGAALHVNGLSFLNNPSGNSYNENIRLAAATNNCSSIVLGATAGTSGTGAGQWAMYRCADPYTFAINYNSSDFLSILSGGNIGIGNSSPVFKLDVSGTARMTDGLIVSDKWFGVSGTSGVARWVKLLQFDLNGAYQHAHYSIRLTSRYYSSELALEAYTTNPASNGYIDQLSVVDLNGNGFPGGHIMLGRTWTGSVQRYELWVYTSSWSNLWFNVLQSDGSISNETFYTSVYSSNKPSGFTQQIDANEDGIIGRNLRVVGGSGSTIGGNTALFLGPNSGGTQIAYCDSCATNGMVIVPTLQAYDSLKVQGNDGITSSISNGLNIASGDFTINSGLLRLYKRSSYNPPACNSSSEGAVFYSTTFQQPCYCNGSDWLTFADGYDCRIY